MSKRNKIVLSFSKNYIIKVSKKSGDLRVFRLTFPGFILYDDGVIGIVIFVTLSVLGAHQMGIGFGTKIPRERQDVLARVIYRFYNLNNKNMALLKMDILYLY